MTQPRFNWYETDQEVVVSVLIKNLKESNVNVKFSDRKFVFNAQNESEEKFNLDITLMGEILPDQCSFSVGTVKVEVHLKKKSNYRWLKLEYKKEDSIFSVPMHLNSVSSSLIDGDRVKRDQEKIRRFEQEIKAVEEEDAKNDGVSEMFKQIYSSSDEKVRKAMNKSFVESNGTVLSTNWNEVGSKTVEMKPPDGVEFKRFDT